MHFPPGTTGPQCIPVSITDDSVLEDLLQSFQVELSVLTNASGRVQLSNNHVATITIQDNDSKDQHKFVHLLSIYVHIYLSIHLSLSPHLTLFPSGECILPASILQPE